MGRHASTDTRPIPVIIPKPVEFVAPEPGKIRKYAKGIVSVAGAVGVAASTFALTPDPTSWEAWINAGIALLTALGVIGVPNRKKKK